MNGKINAVQFFAIIFLCRITDFFTYISPVKASLQPSDRIFTILFFLAFCAVCLAPSIIASRKTGLGVTELAKSVSPVFGCIIFAIYTAALIWTAAESVSRFELFISTVMFPDTNINIITLILLLAAAFAAAKGTEAIGRASVTVLAVLVSSFVFILLTSVSEFDFTNFSPVLYDGIRTAFEYGFASASRTWEILFFALMLPFVNGNPVKIASSWLTFFAITALVGFFVIDGVTGMYGERQMFKLYTLTVLAKLGILERFDDVLIGIWVLCELIKASFCILASAKTFKAGFGKEAPTAFRIFTVAAIFAVFVLSTGSVEQFTKTANSVFSRAAFFICTLVVPTVVYVASKVSHGKEEKKHA